MGYKLKTNKSAAKRFKITAGGKVTRLQAGQRHLLSHESSKLKRNRRGETLVADVDVKKVKRLLAAL